jgi:hypothetical protein
MGKMGDCLSFCVTISKISYGPVNKTLQVSMDEMGTWETNPVTGSAVETTKFLGMKGSGMDSHSLHPTSSVNAFGTTSALN